VQQQGFLPLNLAFARQSFRLVGVVLIFCGCQHSSSKPHGGDARLNRGV